MSTKNQTSRLKVAESKTHGYATNVKAPAKLMLTRDGKGSLGGMIKNILHQDGR
jgi:hypothetical protein